MKSDSKQSETRLCAYRTWKETYKASSSYQAMESLNSSLKLFAGQFVVAFWITFHLPQSINCWLTMSQYKGTIKLHLILFHQAPNSWNQEIWGGFRYSANLPFWLKLGYVSTIHPSSG